MNNLNQIKKLLNFTSDSDSYYELTIIRRKKENPTLTKNAKTVKVFQITSISQLEGKMEEIQTLCRTFTARAYINLNRRSFKKTAFEVNKLIAEYLANGNYKAARASFLKGSGRASVITEKRWLVDIDTKCQNIIEEVVAAVNAQRPNGEKVLATVPTVNGVHLITLPFDLAPLKEMTFGGEKLDVHKNSPTLLCF